MLTNMEKRFLKAKALVDAGKELKLSNAERTEYMETIERLAGIPVSQFGAFEVIVTDIHYDASIFRDLRDPESGGGGRNEDVAAMRVHLRQQANYWRDKLGERVRYSDRGYPIPAMEPTLDECCRLAICFRLPQGDPLREAAVSLALALNILIIWRDTQEEALAHQFEMADAFSIFCLTYCKNLEDYEPIKVNGDKVTRSRLNTYVTGAVKLNVRHVLDDEVSSRNTVKVQTHYRRAIEDLLKVGVKRPTVFQITAAINHRLTQEGKKTTISELSVLNYVNSTYSLVSLNAPVHGDDNDEQYILETTNLDEWAQPFKSPERSLLDTEQEEERLAMLSRVRKYMTPMSWRHLEIREQYFEETGKYPTAEKALELLRQEFPRVRQRELARLDAELAQVRSLIRQEQSLISGVSEVEGLTWESTAYILREEADTLKESLDNMEELDDIFEVMAQYG